MSSSNTQDPNSQVPNSPSSGEKLLEPEELAPYVEKSSAVLQQLDRMLLGREKLHRLVLAGILSRGHILLEGLPGVGKTALVQALGQLLRLDFKRVQFTPDLMPSDILGSHILEETPQGRSMVFHPGPVFTNILLADEINRASPKTQSALLEAMQESSVTLLGETRKLPHPFFVLASQNPIELEGTYPLPEAQLDRFLFKLNVEHAGAEVLDRIISSRRRGVMPAPQRQMSSEDLASLFQAMEDIYLPKAVSRYISRLVEASHPQSAEAPEIVATYVSYGASPRAAIALAEASRAVALLAGRPTVGFEDVEEVARAVLNHRIVLNYQARFDKVGPNQIVDELLQALDRRQASLPEGVEAV
ncbi:MAG TPA: AAA family ATPase [Acidobacteriota bacterium]|nr:AAA family ATPase [Acidobacteriota bacterium]